MCARIRPTGLALAVSDGAHGIRKNIERDFFFFTSIPSIRGVYKTVYENITITFGSRRFLDGDREHTVFLARSTTTFTLKPRYLAQPNLECSNDIDTIFETRARSCQNTRTCMAALKFFLFHKSSCGRTIALYTRGADRGSNLFHCHYRTGHDNFAGPSRKNGKTLGRTRVRILGETRPTALWRVVAEFLTAGRCRDYDLYFCVRQTESEAKLPGG